MSGKALWSEIDGEKWLDNPRRKRRGRKGRRRASARKRRRRGPPKGFSSWSAYMASIRPKRRGRRKGGKSMARRRRSRSRGRRRFRRNPFRLGGFTTRLFQGAKDAFVVTAGKAAARAVPRMLGLPSTGFIGIIAQAGVGVVLAPIIGRFVGGDGAGRMFLAGALQAPVEALAAGLPVIGPLLAGYDYLAAIPSDLGPSDLIEGYANEDDGMGSYGNGEPIA